MLPTATRHEMEALLFERIRDLQELAIVAGLLPEGWVMGDDRDMIVRQRIAGLPDPRLVDLVDETTTTTTTVETLFLAVG